MMHSMNTIDMNFGFSAVWGVHVLAMLIASAGFLFLLVWAIKTLTARQLMQWGLGLLVGGVIVCLLTIGAMGRGTWTSGSMMGGNGMMHFDSDDRQGGMMGGGDMDMMSNMGMMLEGLEGDEFDEAFIRMMIPHHEGAIDMAEEALESSNREEMKKLARDIIEAQQREIDMMEGWLTTWGFEN